MTLKHCFLQVSGHLLLDYVLFKAEEEGLLKVHIYSLLFNYTFHKFLSGLLVLS